MRLSYFIKENIEEILAQWDDFARTMGPPAQTMSSVDLRDHAREMLQSIAQDMQTEQTEAQREAKSKAYPGSGEVVTAAGKHGEMRQRVGFDLPQLGAEYRALRATVLRLWVPTVQTVDAAAFEDVMRFNESMDDSCAEATAAYSAAMSSSRDTFLAVLGHDLRNPLDALNSCVKLLALSEDEAQKQRAFRIARTSISSVKTLIGDLLEYTRSRLGKGMEVRPIPGDFALLCREVSEEVVIAHPQRVFQAKIPDQVDARFDAPRMRQVITNLLTNAVQHGDAEFPIFLEVEQESSVVTLTVKNQGAPIPSEAMKVIFDPLVQVEQAPPQHPGTNLGLGLYIAHEIVTRHGGSMSVTSSAANGTAFTLQMRT